MRKLETPYELFGVECQKGWEGLIKPIFDYIEQYNSNKPKEEQIEVIQVKEKFGGLRFYTNFKTDELKELIRNAESESYKTCEKCGSKDNIGYTVNGWIKTYCLNCVKSIAKENNSTIKWKQNNKIFLVNNDECKEV